MSAIAIDPPKTYAPKPVAAHSTPLADFASAIAAAGSSPRAIIARALEFAERPVLSTNFRPGAFALVHMVTQLRPGIPVIWIDTGYNTPTTYRYIEHLRRTWQLNLAVYTPRVSAARRAAVSDGVPAPAASAFADFVHETKIEPFERAFAEHQPDVWFTGIRREQTAFRAALDVVSAGPARVIRVAPLINWRAAEVEAYLADHALPDNDDYVDPTKPGAHLECGLQLLGSAQGAGR